MMKQKKIIVPILTLAVMLLMVGGVYAVFSSTQPEKSKAENVRDTTDQDYEKGLTEEQKAFNELINKQISLKICYRKLIIFLEILKCRQSLMFQGFPAFLVTEDVLKSP